MEQPNDDGRIQNLEELYAKPYKTKKSQSVTSSEGLYDRLDRQNSMNLQRTAAQNTGKRTNLNEDTGSVTSITRKLSRGENATEMRSERRRQSEDEMGQDRNDTDSVLSYQRSLANQSVAEFDMGQEKYRVEVLETKDTNDIVKELGNLGLDEFSDRLIVALRNRFELESAFIEACTNDGVVIVEGDSDEGGNEHQSIGGLRVKGMKPSCVNYDEYDPDIITKYGFFAHGHSKEKLANDAAELRRRAANMLWAVENMERMIDPNSRVRYVRQEGENH